MFQSFAASFDWRLTMGPTPSPERTDDVIRSDFRYSVWTRETFMWRAIRKRMWKYCAGERGRGSEKSAGALLWLGAGAATLANTLSFNVSVRRHCRGRG